MNDQKWVVVVIPLYDQIEPSVIGPWTHEDAKAEAAAIRELGAKNVFHLVELMDVSVRRASS
jgi:hypothetical protein